MKQPFVCFTRAMIAVAALTTVGLAQAKVASDVRASGLGPSKLAIMASPVTVTVKNMPLRQAVRAVAASARVRVLYVRDVSDWDNVTVSLHANKMPLREALAILFRGTALQAVPLQGDLITITPEGRSMGAGAPGGVITGTVVDATTKQPVRGAVILLDDATRGTPTDEHGTFRIANVSAGEHRLTTRFLGYTRQIRTITVHDGETTTVSFGVAPSVNALDQVVVTGTMAATELKAVPNAMTVITAKEIEQRGITRIDQLFRGDVPGVFSVNNQSGTPLNEVTMFSRGATKLPQSGVSATNPIKTYVDGVEMADARYLSQIDPRSIERIEILTGPQASTIYGSNTINGVMQIFTKRSHTVRPQVTLSALSGLMENNFTPRLTPQHDDGIQVTGTDGHLSYSVGGSYEYSGAWAPSRQTARTTGFGGERMQVGPLSVDGSFRLGRTRNRATGTASQPVLLGNPGQYSLFTPNLIMSPTNSTLLGQTLGMTANYAPLSWWSHELVIGSDAAHTEYRYTAPGFRAPSDTLLYFSQSNTARISERYVTTAQLPLTTWMNATATAGADWWHTRGSNLGAYSTSLTGTLSTNSYLTRAKPDRNHGAFFQGQLGVRDAVFFTYGLRAEWNPNMGDAVQPNLAPRYGVAYTQDMGALTLKLRAAYGRSTRPPGARQKNAIPALGYLNSDYVSIFGNFDAFRANSNLLPESQKGGEGGLEMYFGSRGSLVVTRYNQTVDNLIAAIIADTIRAPASTCLYFYIYPDGNCHADIQQYWNIGNIRNQGWELQGKMTLGPITSSGTYSWTTSRMIGRASTFPYWTFGTADLYLPGISFDFLPEHTWAANFTYAHSANTLSLNVNGVGFLYRDRDGLYLALGYDRMNNDKPRMSLPARYRSSGHRYAIANLNGSHTFSPRIEGVFQVQNLNDYYQNDNSAQNAALGRQTELGLRIRM